MIVHTTAPVLRTLLRVDQKERPGKNTRTGAVQNSLKYSQFARSADGVSNDRTTLKHQNK